MKKNSFSLVLVAAFCWMSLDAEASGIYTLLAKRKTQRLVYQVQKEISNIDQGLEKDQSSKVYAGGPESSWAFHLQRIRLRVRPFVSFNVPGIVSLRIRPWVELDFRRKPPAGWGNYKPWSI